MTYKKQAFVPYIGNELSAEQSLKASEYYLNFLSTRRSLRHFSDRPVSREVMRNILMSASSAPSGAHKQPWIFAAVSDSTLKKKIRGAAEKEEYTNYHGRMSEEWLKDLEKFDTNWEKPFLEDAPWLIIVFKKAFDYGNEGEKLKNYYVNESVGIASGFLLTAIHNAGLASLTHTPSPMNFLEKIMERPDNERAFLLIPVGYPAEGAVVPELTRKGEDEVIIWK